MAVLQEEVGTAPTMERRIGDQKLMERATRRKLRGKRTALPDGSAAEPAVDDHGLVNECTNQRLRGSFASEATVTFGEAQPVSVPRRRTMTKTARVYKIEMLIRNRGHVSFQALLDELEV